MIDWLKLTALGGKKTLVCLDRVDWVSTGYDLPGCVIHFAGGQVRSVSDDLETITRAIRTLGQK